MKSLLNKKHKLKHVPFTIILLQFKLRRILSQRLLVVIYSAHSHVIIIR